MKKPRPVSQLVKQAHLNNPQTLLKSVVCEKCGQLKLNQYCEVCIKAKERNIALTRQKRAMGVPDNREIDREYVRLYSMKTKKKVRHLRQFRTLLLLVNELSRLLTIEGNQDIIIKSDAQERARRVHLAANKVLSGWAKRYFSSDRMFSFFTPLTKFVVGSSTLRR